MGNVNNDLNSEIQKLKNIYESAGLKPGARCCVSFTISGLLQAGLFVCACIGAAGKFSNPTFGWVALGLAGGMFITSLAATTDLKKRMNCLSVLALATIVCVALGVLGTKGMLSSRALGSGLLGTLVGGFMAGCFLERLTDKMNKTHGHHSH